MNISDIIDKNTLSTDQMVFVVEQYIKEKKDYDCDINLLKNLNANNPFFQALYSRQLTALNRAYDIAVEYFQEKKLQEKK